MKFRWQQEHNITYQSRRAELRADWLTTDTYTTVAGKLRNSTQLGNGPRTDNM